MKTLKFFIEVPDDLAAGIVGYTEEIALRVESGNPGGEPGEFAGSIKQTLSEWYDGARVQFEEIEETPRPKINAGLLAALNHFSASTYDQAKPHVFVHRSKDGTEKYWSLESTCELAYEILRDEYLYFLKFEAFKEGMKLRGMHKFYEFIMGEQLR